MRTLYVLIKRHTKLFFKDKGMFFTSLITPAILLVLYSTFLGKVFHDSFQSSLPPTFILDEKIIDAFVAAQLVSSLLAISCVTVAFCSNMLMVQDRANNTIKDFTISPVNSSLLAVSYFISSFISTIVVMFVTTAICLVYMAFIGFYMSFSDVLLLLLDIILLTLFGTALSSAINFFLSTQGQISAVGTIVSAGYGFICGAYMPISQFSDGLQKVMSFFPGTYGTSLLRNHTMKGVLKKIHASGVPNEVIDGIRDSIDCNIYFFDKKVTISAMYLFIIGSILFLLALYVLLQSLKKRKKPKN